MSYSVCPNVMSAYENLSVKGTIVKVDCSVKPYKFFDQIIVEEYEKGCRIFFCEIGRGSDYNSINHYEDFVQLDSEIYENEKCSEDTNDMKGKFCIIQFGSLSSRQPLKINDNKIIKTKFAFDVHFVNEFIKWFNDFALTHDVMIEFLDMTWNNIIEPKGIMLEFINDFNKLYRNSLITFSTYNYKTVDGVVQTTFHPTSHRLYKMNRSGVYLNTRTSMLTDRETILTDNNFFNLFDKFMLDRTCIDKDVLEGGNYKNKYLKYKSKYLELKKLLK